MKLGVVKFTTYGVDSTTICNSLYFMPLDSSYVSYPIVIAVIITTRKNHNNVATAYISS